MNRLNIWNKEDIINKIAICMNDRPYSNQAEECFQFPLPDILFSFYKTANITEEFYSLESLKKLLARYKVKNKDFEGNVEELAQKGWISLSFGHWKSALTNIYRWEDADDWEFADAAVIRFLIWLKRQEGERKFNVEVADPGGILKGWKAVCDTAPGLDWFIDQHYLVCLNGKYYASYGRYHGNRAVNQALARLWMEWRKDRKETWIAAALSLRGSYHIAEYMDEDARRGLIQFILDDYVYKYPIPSWEEENRFYSKLWMAEKPEYCKDPEKYGKAQLWTGSRVVDLLSYRQYGFEHYRWDDVREWEYTFFIASCAIYSRWCEDRQNKKLADYLNGYDKISALYYTLKLSGNAVYDLLAGSGTFFIGFRYLIHDIDETTLDPDTYVGFIGNIVDVIFKQGIRERDFFESEDIGNCLLYLMMNCRLKRNTWEKLLKAVSLIIGKEEYLEVIAGALCAFFRTLLKSEYDGDWATGYHLILFCVNQWLLERPSQQEKWYYRNFMDIVWEGFQIAFDGKSSYITFLKAEYFPGQLCSELYKLYIKENSAAKKRKLLLPADNVQYQAKDNRICYFYRLLLTIIYHIYENNEEPFVKRILFEVLEQVLIGKHNTEKRAIFDYSYMQIFSTEAVICKCIGLLRCGQEDSDYLLKNLLEADVPELLIFYGAAQDQELKAEILQKINEKATRTSLEVYDDSHALDLVMDFQIESLYPAVEYMIEKKLKHWGKGKGIKKQSYYQAALHQQWRLMYCRKKYEDILRGDNLFFQAIVYMEADGYRDYEKADKIWKGMILNRTNHKYASSVFLNYFYLLNKVLNDAVQEQSVKRERILENISWLIDIVEKEQIQNWSMDDKEAFGWFVVQSKKIQGGDYLYDFYIYKEKYQLTIGIEEFLDETKPGTEVPRQKAYSNSGIDNIVEALRAFEAFDRTPKAQIYYRMRGYQELKEKDWGAVMLTEQVLSTCHALQNYGSQLIFKDKEIVVNSKTGISEVKSVEKLYEDGVTMLFRELYNLAFGRLYSFTVHDQEKRGRTGKTFGGHNSPAEIDLSVYYKGKCSEIMEAFVLKDDSSKTVFRDHMEKALGNNIAHQPLTFMLIYGNARNSVNAWEKYRNYISQDLQGELSDSIEKTLVLELGEAPYYLEEFKNYTGLKLLRQSISLTSGETQEILHIYIDIAENDEAEIRGGQE